MIKIDDYRRVAPPGVVDIILKLSERVHGRRLLFLSIGEDLFVSGVSAAPGYEAARLSGGAG